MSKFKRTTVHKCTRCGLCCQGRGDFAFDLHDEEPEFGPDDCTALQFDGKLAVCELQYDKRDCCLEYPGDELCERELKKAGLWEKYTNQYPPITVAKKVK